MKQQEHLENEIENSQQEGPIGGGGSNPPPKPTKPDGN
jgi:hypothetical protein